MIGETQSSDAATLSALVRAGVIERGEISTLRAAIRSLDRVGTIRRLAPKHAEIIQRVYSNSLAGETGSSMAISAIKQNLNNQFEITQTDFVSEAVTDPPQMIVLKRKGIRVFPDGKRVALYVNDKLNLNFTIPYSSTGMQNPTAMQEEAAKPVQKKPAPPGDNLGQIKKILNTGTETELSFKNGGSMSVDRGTAHLIHTLHTSLNDKNKTKMEKLINKSDGHFQTVLAFAKKNVSGKVKKPMP